MSKIIGIDVDGVLLKWEEAFDDFMTGQGLTKKDQGHFDLRKHYPDVPAEAVTELVSDSLSDSEIELDDPSTSQEEVVIPEVPYQFRKAGGRRGREES